MDMMKEAKKKMLKKLAGKMFQLEKDAYKKGDGPKPEAVKKEMRETKVEKSVSTPKMDKNVKDMVRGFFKEKMEDGKDVQMAGFIKRSAPPMPKKKMVARKKKVSKKG